MNTPDPIRAALERLVELYETDWDTAGWDDAIAAARAALEAAPPTPAAGEVGFSATWDTVAIVAQDMLARGLAEHAAGEELLKAAIANRNRPDSTTPPAGQEGK